MDLLLLLSLFADAAMTTGRLHSAKKVPRMLEVVYCGESAGKEHSLLGSNPYISRGCMMLSMPLTCVSLVTTRPLQKKEGFGGGWLKCFL